MTEYVLTVLDTTGIQDYVFGTNNLQQITGASYLVNCATRDWVKDALSPMKHNEIDFNELANPFGNQRIEDGVLDAELIYAGGGNTVIVFTTMEKAALFTRILTKRIFTEAPGLNVVITHQPFSWDTPLGGESGAWQMAFKALARRKAQGRVTPPLLGRAVTAECVFTSLPAVGRDNDNRLISAEADAKKRNAKTALTGILGGVELSGFNLPAYEFEQLGVSPGEKSLLAVVHIDGNGMGKRIETLRDEFSLAADNRAFLDEMRRFSISVQKASHDALEAVVARLKAAVDKNGTIGGRVPIIENRLPFRPIIFGGDDVTLVCDGRLGLGLASAYLSELNKQPLSDGKNLVCRAGVSIVKSHYPFARAYDLAEKLCASAKKHIRSVRDELTKSTRMQIEEDELRSISAIDWHIATAGLGIDLEDIRQREYCVEAGKLNARPLTIQLPDAITRVNYIEKWRSWENFILAVSEFQNGESWAESHNKVKALREVLRGGGDEVLHFNTLYRVNWPKLADLDSDALKKGWAGGHCLYFDAVEMVDIFISL